MILLELIFGVIFDILLQFPGALLRYILAKNSKKFILFLNDDKFILNYIISIIFYLAIYIITRNYFL